MSLSFSLIITLNGIYFSSFFRTQQQNIEAGKAKKPPAKAVAVDPTSKEAAKVKATPAVKKAAPAVPKKATTAVKEVPKDKKAAPAIKDAPPKTEARPKTRARQ